MRAHACSMPAYSPVRRHATHPCPSAPTNPSPHDHRAPHAVTAHVWRPPHATMATRARKRPAPTSVGVIVPSSTISSSSPSPSLPASPAPHAYSSPCRVTAAEWWVPAATIATRPPPNPCTCAGPSLSPSVPRPRRPPSPFPHAHSAPVSVRAKVCASPQTAMSTRSPPSRSAATAAGRRLSARSPCPNAPSAPLPQTKTRPSCVTADVCAAGQGARKQGGGVRGGGGPGLSGGAGGSAARRTVLTEAARSHLYDHGHGTVHSHGVSRGRY